MISHDINQGSGMLAVLRRVFIYSAISATAVSAQTPALVPPPDSAIASLTAQNSVTAVSIKSGRLVLSSAANPGKTLVPDGTYTNELNTIIVIADGRIARIQESSGAIMEVESIRQSRQGVIRVVPSTNALMAVSERPLPSGTFRTEDGQSSIKIVFGRPTEFTIPSARKDEQK